MAELLWESERPAGPDGGHYQLYRIADGSLHLTVDEAYGANLTLDDIVQLERVLALERADR